MGRCKYFEQVTRPREALPTVHRSHPHLPIHPGAPLQLCWVYSGWAWGGFSGAGRLASDRFHFHPLCWNVEIVPVGAQRTSSSSDSCGEQTMVSISCSPPLHSSPSPLHFSREEQRTSQKCFDQRGGGCTCSQWASLRCLRRSRKCI